MRALARVARASALVALSLALFAGSLEVALRALPRAIPLNVLVEFEPSLRAAIAQRRDLQRRDQTVMIPRDDGGPRDRLWVYEPGIAITHRFDEPGAVETVVTDERGFCNEPADLWRAPHFDVIAVGDSFTWCTTVEPRDAWPARLASGTGLSVYNMGLGGRGLYEYVQILKQLGLAKSPDFVVMNVYEGNDLRDAWYFHRARRGQGDEGCPLRYGAACATARALRGGFIGRHSYALNLLAGTVLRLADRAEHREVVFHYDVRFPDGVVLEFDSVNADPDEVVFARRLAEGVLSTALFDGAMESFAELADRHGFAPLVLYTPSMYTAYASLTRFREPSIGQEIGAFSDALRRYFAQRSCELGLPYLDATPALQRASEAAPSAERLYFATNFHLTRAGHALVADEVARALAPMRAAPAGRRRAAGLGPGCAAPVRRAAAGGS